MTTATLPPEVHALVDRIVREYHPDRVILFGSYAEGRAHQDSDVDLLVIKESDLGPIHRTIELRRLLRDRSRRFPLDLVVLTPAEVEAGLASGNPMVEHIVRRGVVLHAA